MYATEEQQIEQLKKIWKEYGWPTILGVLIAIVIVFSWRFYQEYKTRLAETASNLYAQMMADVLNQRSDEAIKGANQLESRYANTPYAAASAFSMAKLDVANQHFDAAQKDLDWVIKHSNNKTFREIATIRLARILLFQKNPKDALKLLGRVHSKAFSSLVSEIRGDAYMQLGMIDNARTAYQTALDQLPNDSLIQPLWRMKIKSLPVAK